MNNIRLEGSLPKSRLGAAFCVRLKRLRDGQEGATALEFAFVLPVLVFLLTGMIDAGHLFFMQNNMLNATREAARNLAVGQVTEQEAEDQVEARMANYSSATFNVNATLPDPAIPTQTDLTVVTTVNISDVVLIDVVGLSNSIFQSGTLQSQITMRQER